MHLAILQTQADATHFHLDRKIQEMTGKRAMAARMCAVSGLTRLLEILPKRNGLMVLNYHRVGNPLDTPYDPGTFGPTAEEFDYEVSYIKRRFHSVGLEEALTLIDGKARFRSSVLLTFDDGYIDNYKVVYPILRSHGLPAVFFLPTGFIGSLRLPWWDVIAFLVKHSRRDVIRLHYPEAIELRIDAGGVGAVRSVLELCLKHGVTDYSPLITELEDVCDCPRPGASAERCFVNWEEVREMERGGMAFGSHTHSHEILSGLSPQQQVFELRESRAILERELGHRVTVLAYPVGLPYTFDSGTMTILRNLGYEAAFSYYGGLNTGQDLNRFDVCRFHSDAETNDLFRLQTTLNLLGTTGVKRWPQVSMPASKAPVPAAVPPEARGATAGTRS